MSSGLDCSATILNKFTSTVFPCDTTSDARYIRCDFKRCSKHVLNSQVIQLPVHYWILNTEKNVKYLEKHVSNEIYNFISSLEDDEYELNGAERCPSGKDRYELNTRFLEKSSGLNDYEKLLVVFNLRDPQSNFGRWLDLFLSAVKKEDSIEINYLCIALSFSSRKELLNQVGRLHSITSNRNLEVIVVLSCHSSTQGQVFSCTPTSISKFYNFEEFCSVHDFVCACQEVLKNKLKWLHISSCYAMKLNSSHRDWPVHHAWLKNVKCILSGSAKEVYETGSQTADLFLLLNTILLPNDIRTQFHLTFNDASLNLFPDLILEMGLTVGCSSVISAMLENPERNDNVTNPKVINSSVHFIVIYSDEDHLLKEALVCNLENRKSSDVKLELTSIKIRIDEANFSSQLLDAFNSLLIPISKSIFFLVLGSSLNNKPIEVVETISLCQQKSMFQVYGVHINRMAEKDLAYFKNGSTNLNFSITGFVEKCGVSSKYTSPVLLYIVHLSLGENGSVVKDGISSSWSFEDVFKETMYVLPGLCKRSNLTLISKKNVCHKDNNDCDVDRNSPENGNIKLCELKPLRKRKGDTSYNCVDVGNVPFNVHVVPDSNDRMNDNHKKSEVEIQMKTASAPDANKNCNGNMTPVKMRGIPTTLPLLTPHSNIEFARNLMQFDGGGIPPKLRSVPDRNLGIVNSLGNGDLLAKVKKIFYVSDHCNKKEIKVHRTINIDNIDKMCKNVIIDTGVSSHCKVNSPKLGSSGKIGSPKLGNRSSATNELASSSIKHSRVIQNGTHEPSTSSSSSNNSTCLSDDDDDDVQITAEKKSSGIFDIFSTDLKDVPLMANVDEVLVDHYKLDLDVNFEEKCIEGNILFFIRPTSNEVISKDFQLCLDCTLIDIECVQEISLPEDFEIHFHMKSCCCVKASRPADKPKNVLCKSCSLLQNYKKHLSTDLSYRTLSYSVYGWCIRIWKNSKDWPRCVHIKYRTKPVGPSLMWCHDNDGNPCTFTPGAYINNRSMMPCQEPPVAMSTWQASITVPDGFLVLSSGDKLDCKRSLLQDGVTNKFFFEMSIPLPSSTLAFAVGKYVRSSRVIPVLCSPNRNIVTVSLYASPAKIEPFESEYLELAVKYLKSACAILGEYPFTRLDLVIMPKSFACLGLQSPNLTFLSQSILCGDQSMSTRIAHEISHSWFGLLVGSEDWTEEWLSEGFATYIEDRILAHAQGMNSCQFLNYSHLLQIIRFKTLKAEIEVTVDDNLKRLRPKKSKNSKTAVEAVNDSILDTKSESPEAYNMVPDAAVSSKKWSQVHYLKGYFLLLHMAKLVGFESFDIFLKHYISTYAGTLVTSDMFFNLYLCYYSLPTKIKEEIISQWMESTTLPMSSVENSISNILVSVVEVETKYWMSNNSSNKRCKAAGKKRRRDMFKTRPYLDSNQLVLLLENLLSVQELLPQTLTQMNRVYQFEIRNSEVRHRWCELVIKHLYYVRYDQVKRYLIEDQGMGIYLFGEMVITCNPRQLSLAKEVFEIVKGEMDRSTCTTVSEILYGEEEENL